MGRPWIADTRSAKAGKAGTGTGGGVDREQSIWLRDRLAFSSARAISARSARRACACLARQQCQLRIAVHDRELHPRVGRGLKPE